MFFYTPPSLADDYKAFLQSDVCYDISFCHDISADEPVWIDERAEITPINYKSKQYGSDNSLKISVAYDTQMQKGDMLVHDGKTYLVTWQVNRDRPNSKSSQIELANGLITIKRDQKAVADPTTGNIISRAGEVNVIEDLRCVIISSGGYDYKANNMNPGIIPNNRIAGYIQANSDTFKIKLNDRFDFFDAGYHIVEIKHTELNYDGKSGLLVISAERITNNQ